MTQQLDENPFRSEMALAVWILFFALVTVLAIILCLAAAWISESHTIRDTHATATAVQATNAAGAAGFYLPSATQQTGGGQ